MTVVVVGSANIDHVMRLPHLPAGALTGQAVTDLPTATAAGDTCCGALAAALAGGATLRKAALFALAARCVATGAQPGIPRRDRILQLLGATHV